MPTARSLFFCLVLASLVVGCSESSPTSITQDEMSEYMQQNPEAAKDYGDVDLDSGDTAN